MPHLRSKRIRLKQPPASAIEKKQFAPLRRLSQCHELIKNLIGIFWNCYSLCTSISLLRCPLSTQKPRKLCLPLIWSLIFVTPQTLSKSYWKINVESLLSRCRKRWNCINTKNCITLCTKGQPPKQKIKLHSHTAKLHVPLVLWADYVCNVSQGSLLSLRMKSALGGRQGGGWVTQFIFESRAKRQ